MELQRKTLVWNVRRFAFLDQEPEAIPSPLQLSDVLLGPFDEERLGEYAPDSDLPDWCPPPKALMGSEMQDFLDWVESEADIGDLYPDPATYPFDDYFDREDLYVCKF